MKEATAQLKVNYHVVQNLRETQFSRSKAGRQICVLSLECSY